MPLYTYLHFAVLYYSGVPTVTGLRVTQLSHQSVTFEWDVSITEDLSITWSVDSTLR